MPAASYGVLPNLKKPIFGDSRRIENFCEAYHSDWIVAGRDETVVTCLAGEGIENGTGRSNEDIKSWLG